MRIGLGGTNTHTLDIVTQHMTSIVDKLNEFRGTRLAQGISTTIFLGLGLYNLSFESGESAFVIGVLFSAYGLLGIYKLLVGESITQSVSS